MLFIKQVTDPVWGAFRLTEVEDRVLRTPELTRLQQIKQLGLAFLDYSGLNHSRLEHSLGVMYVADSIYEILQVTAKDNLSDVVRGRIFNSQNRQAVRLAALLHDLGHPPFSHAVELTFKKFPGLLKRALSSDYEDQETRESLFSDYSHESFTEWIILKSPNLLTIIHEHFRSDELATEIAKLAIGKAEGELFPFNQVISGDLDADRIDYLIRDNRHSGFSLGLSPEELYGSMHLLRGRGQKRNSFELIIDSRAVPFVNSVLSARNRLIRRVHLAPLGRSATQMVVTYLHGVLSKYRDDSELAKVIVRIHQECNDFSFFGEVKRRLNKGRSSLGLLGSHIVSILEGRSREGIWEEHSCLDFSHMHPCLRLIVYIGASCSYNSPQDQRFNYSSDPDCQIFIEPSTRPAPKFSLLVDFDRNPQEPGLDYMAVTENEPGRANLWQSLSNLDLYSYKVDRQGHGGRPANDTKTESYTQELMDKQNLAARCAVSMARKIVRGRNRSLTTKGALPSHYILTLLYALEQMIIENFETATGIYVYRGEYFMNRFMGSLLKEFCFPKEFRGSAGAHNVNRIFIEVQRLEVFGLVEARRNPIFHSRKNHPELKRTRFGIYSRRKDFRISAWGSHYVENEVAGMVKSSVCQMVSERQGRVLNELQAIGDSYWKLCERQHVFGGGSDRLESLDRFYARLEKMANTIIRSEACPMVFCLPGICMPE